MTRTISNVALLFALIIFLTALTPAQAGAGRTEATTLSVPAPQLEFVGKEDYGLNGANGTRYKLSVMNRASHPDFLWLPSSQLPPCGNNKNSARTWVEVFGSPGDRRLSGFCALRASEDLGHLWFPVPSGEQGPPCVYIVMTDRRIGKKFQSNRVCSRSFATATGSFKGSAKAGPQTSRGHEGDKGWIEISSVQFNKDKEREAGLHEIQAEKAKEKSQGNQAVTGRVTGIAIDPSNSAQPAAPVQGGTGRDQISSFGSGNNSTSGPTHKGTRVLQPDLVIKQFLFPPTNDKALRVQVVNQGNAASGASRLNLTVRRINGTAVGRQTHVNIPALAPNKTVWLLIDAKSILPNNVSLQSTTFKLNADATEIVVESNETNNEVWHNL